MESRLAKPPEGQTAKQPATRLANKTRVVAQSSAGISALEDGANAANALHDTNHVGLALVRAADKWKSRMRAAMAERGFPWHLEARGEILAHLGPSGRSQSALASEMGVSKQAVQQLVDQLVADGVVRRVKDPQDKRARRVELTELGMQDFAARKIVKREIENQYRDMLGDDTFTILEAALAKMR